MEEHDRSAKRRERIKTILIIFLIILLLLTFFSNTIMNYSLPTVTAQYASYGTISEKVRGSGIVAANQSYDVLSEGDRTVSKVLVKVGDEVKAGDQLFVLDAANSEESIKTAEEAIRAAELEYQKALLTAAPDYTAENQEIANARADLQTARARLAAAGRGTGGISAAAFQQASKTAADAGERIATLKGYLAVLDSGETEGVPAEYLTDASAAQAAFEDASARLADATADLEAKTAALTVTSAEQRATITSLQREAEKAETAYQRAKADADADPADTELVRAMEDAQTAARYAREDVEAAQAALTDIQSQEAAIAAAKTAVTQATAEVEAARRAKSDALGTPAYLIQNDINAAQAELDDANATIAAYEAQGEGSAADDPDALQETVTSLERALQEKILALAKTQKDDKLSSQVAALDLQGQQDAIQKQKEALEKLKKDAGTVTVTSKNSGIMNAVNFAAGDEVPDGSVLGSVTLTDQGYTLQFTVSADQARKVKVGTLAEITNAYYSDITAKLVSSRADTEDPTSQNRILTFDISGSDVTPGQMLALSISCSSQSYDCVVPNSAIRTDNDGKFVLVMRSKNTPLGNRYYADRVDVKVLAADEISSAVQGEVNFSDFVITTSEKPIEPGAQVRMEDKT